MTHPLFNPECCLCPWYCVIQCMSPSLDRLERRVQLVVRADGTFCEKRRGLWVRVMRMAVAPVEQYKCTHTCGTGEVLNVEENSSFLVTWYRGLFLRSYSINRVSIDCYRLLHIHLINARSWSDGGGEKSVSSSRQQNDSTRCGSIHRL
jgi:hypothetical protein